MRDFSLYLYSICNSHVIILFKSSSQQNILVGQRTIYVVQQLFNNCSSLHFLCPSAGAPEYIYMMIQLEMSCRSRLVTRFYELHSLVQELPMFRLVFHLLVGGKKFPSTEIPKFHPPSQSELSNKFSGKATRYRC